MKDKKRILSLLLVCVLSLTVLAGCGSDKGESSSSSSEAPKSSEAPSSSAEASTPEASVPEEPEETDYADVDFRVRWWGSDSRHTPTITILEDWAKDYLNLEVESEYTAWGDYWTSLSTLATGHTMPDVLQMDYSYLYSYGKAGQLLNLDDYVASGALDLSNVDEGTLATGMVDGHLMAVPTGINAPVMFYNPDPLEEAGVTLSMTPTWDEFLEVARAVTEKTGMYGQLWTEEHSYRMMGVDGVVMDGDVPKVGYTAEQFAKKWSDAMAFEAEGLMPTVDEMALGVRPAMAALECWCNGDWSNQLAVYQQESVPNVAMCAMPHTDEAPSPSYAKPTMLWSVSADSKNPDLAVAFINYFVNTPYVYEVCGVDRGIPISSEMKAYCVDVLFKDDESKTQEERDAMATQRAMIEMLDTLQKENQLSAPPIPTPAGYEEAALIRDEYAERIRWGDIKEEDYVSAGQEMIDRMNEAYANAAANASAE